MKPSELALVCSVALLVPACLGSADSKPRTAAQAKTAAAAPDTTPAAPPAAALEATPTPPPAPAPEPAPEPAAPAAESSAPANLGENRIDPRWFRKTIFGDKGNVLDSKRTEADEQGRFSSLIRFELTDMDVEGCADHLEGMVKDDIPTVERKPQDARIQLEGSTADYSITFVCGEANGKTIAYVSFTWT
ncbi:MAG: hypothetical protein AB1Z98_32610 [Nannocystaceae bacterium]